MKSNQKTKIELIKESRGRKVYSVQGQQFEVESRYTIDSSLGRGAYGMVCGAVDETTNERVAIKCISRVFEELVDGRRIWREMVVLRLLKEYGCRNALQLRSIQTPKESIASFRDIYLVTDLYALDLFGFNRLKTPVRIDAIRTIIAQILRCVADMHSLGIIHRDIKPNNILLKSAEEPSSAVLCDFGLARAGLNRLALPMRMTDYVVTRWYRPPELLLGCPYDYAVDVWSLGCVLAECVIKVPLFPGKDYIQQLQLVIAAIPVTGISFIVPNSSPSISHIREMAKLFQGLTPLSQILHDLPPDGLDVVTKLLAFEPSKRLTAKGALAHPFFAAARDEKKQPSSVKKGVSDAHLEDIGFDLHAEVSESQLRRLIWNEVQFYQGK